MLADLPDLDAISVRYGADRPDLNHIIFAGTDAVEEWMDDAQNDRRVLLAYARACKAMLEKHQWAPDDGRDHDAACPECRQRRWQPHASDCDLARIIGAPRVQ